MATSIQPAEVKPPSSPRKYWTRRGTVEWLTELLSEDQPTLVGIDHSFSFPLNYFRENHLLLDWTAFLDDFQAHWPTDQYTIYVQFVRDGVCGNATARSGDRHWRRLTEVRTGAKSVFHFDVQGSVAKSTHAISASRSLAGSISCRSTAGTSQGQSVVAEVYPALWNRSFPRDGRDAHQQDAYSIAAWMRRVDGDGSLSGFFDPHLTHDAQKTAEIEGWILGVA